MNLQFWKPNPTPNLSAILFSNWSIAKGLLQLFPALHLPSSSTVLAMLAVGSSVVILLDVKTSTLFLKVVLLAIIVGLVVLRH